MCHFKRQLYKHWQSIAWSGKGREYEILPEAQAKEPDSLALCIVCPPIPYCCLHPPFLNVYVCLCTHIKYVLYCTLRRAWKLERPDAVPIVCTNSLQITVSLRSGLYLRRLIVFNIQKHLNSPFVCANNIGFFTFQVEAAPPVQPFKKKYNVPHIFRDRNK
jgi:hypothetical protein